MIEVSTSVWWRKWLKKGWPVILAFILGFMIALPLGIFLAFKQVFSPLPRGSQHRLGQVNLINPLLYCEIGTREEFNELKPLQEVLKKNIENSKQKGLVQAVSVYFRAMNSGRWTGINENDEFTAASLLKVPVMISYYKYTEAQPNILTQTLKFEGGADLNATQNFKPAIPLRVGQIYSMGELIDSMIRYSENNAAALLTHSADPALIERTYHDLDVPIKEDPNHDQVLTPREYSNFFRTLYNANYLNSETSEQALQLLTQTEFKDGLVAGVPTETRVAHKFGESTFLGDDQKVQSAELHDCGIVYYPNHPYFVCVMTRGKQLAPLTGVIQDISKTVYDFVNHLHQGKG